MQIHFIYNFSYPMDSWWRNKQCWELFMGVSLWSLQACRENVFSHIVGVSFQWSNHGDEEWLLQQGDHSANHGLEACQRAKVVGRVAVGKI